MQSPLETSVQALRNTRLVEEICAWTTINIRFHPMLSMHGLAPTRRRSSSTCGAMPTLPAPTRSSPMRSIARPMSWNSGEPICRADAKSSPTAFTDVKSAKAWPLPCASWGSRRTSWKAALRAGLNRDCRPAATSGLVPSKWVTREHPKIDRIACPWLIRRFIDPNAEFIYVPKDQVARRRATDGRDSLRHRRRGIHA